MTVAAFEVGEVVHIRGEHPQSLQAEINEVYFDDEGLPYYSVIRTGLMRWLNIAGPLISTYREHELISRPPLIQLAEIAE